MAVASLLCSGGFTSYLDGHFAELLALLFMQAFLLYAVRLLRRFNLADLVAGGLMMGAVVYTSLTISIIMIIGFGCVCALSWSKVGRGIAAGSRWGLLIGFPAVALLGTAPWLINNAPLLFPISPSPYPADITLLRDIVLGNGILIVPLAVWGIVVAFRDNAVSRLVNWLMLIWLLAVLDLCLFGVERAHFAAAGRAGQCAQSGAARRDSAFQLVRWHRHAAYLGVAVNGAAAAASARGGQAFGGSDGPRDHSLGKRV